MYVSWWGVSSSTETNRVQMHMIVAVDKESSRNNDQALFLLPPLSAIPLIKRLCVQTEHLFEVAELTPWVMAALVVFSVYSCF